MIDRIRWFHNLGQRANSEADRLSTNDFAAANAVNAYQESLRFGKLYRDNKQVETARESSTPILPGRPALDSFVSANIHFSGRIFQWLSSSPCSRKRSMPDDSTLITTRSARDVYYCRPLTGREVFI
jgi:hypothetical protein